MRQSLIICLFICFFLSSSFIFSEDSVPIQTQDTADSYFQSALKNYIHEDYTEALRFLRECLNLDPQYSKATKLLPLVLKRQDEELRSQEKKTNSLLAEEHFRLATNLYIMGKLGAAIEELEKALEIVPNHKKAKELLDKILAKTRPKEEIVTPLLPPEKAKEKITISFKDASIVDVLNTFSQMYQLNIITSADVTGNININFTDVALEDALKTIFAMQGYSYKVEGNIINVYKENEAAIIIKTFHLKNATLSTEQITKIKEALSSDGKIFYDSKTRTLMVTEISKNMKSLEELLQRLDSMRRQVLIEARVLDVNLNRFRQLGIDWTLNLSLQTTSTTKPIAFPFIPGGATIFDQFIPLPKPGEVGTDFPATGRRADLPFAEKSQFTLGSLTGPSLGAVLQALQTKTDTTLLSNPRILAMDDEEAKIVVGTNYPVPTFERNSTTGKFEITGYTEKEVGIVLTVTPQIFENDKITLVLHPEVSAITGTLPGEIPYPIISTREALTTVNIKNGDTLVLGGLITEKDIETLKKIPVLGSIPFFGALFRSREKTKERTELLVFITVNIVPS
ncbi:MAG: hypothetical protein COX40_04180 [Candidatus Omnitrophica bacterium CG23_combo_of_CG06-09_8_20_14_all_40_11]|nr:MAG: hypothetical protein COX40_04180 [Candidatus Omnitrophica bacterium CG23_combo_of_CG06-09_8_20_14_all_40_11]